MARLRLRPSQDTSPGAHPSDTPPPAGAIPTANGHPRLGDLLIAARAIGLDELDAALAAQAEGTNKRLGRILVDAGVLDEDTLAGVLSHQLGIPRADLRTIAPDPAAAATIPEAMARTLACFPLRIEDGVLEVVAGDPAPDLTSKLATASGLPVRLQIATPAEVARLLDGAYRVLGDVERYVKAFERDDAARSHTTVSTGGLDEDAPVVQVVNKILTQALRDRASDIHLEPLTGELRVRFRIDGALHEALTLPEAMSAAVISRLKIMANLNIVERRRPQDGQFSLTIDGRAIDMRISVLATIWGEKCVIRLLDTNRSALAMDELGMPTATHTQFSQLIHAPFGMVLCAGPTGSGKTTTLYSALREIDQIDRNITTIEDPVEYVFSGINQIQVSEQAGLTFATGLKSILRQDPDVILVGEIRDAETARIAVQSALTGHFVLSTLHGTDAAAALHRLLDMGIESFLIASSVMAVVSQRLVRRICDACREPYDLPPEHLAFYEESGGRPKAQFMRGAGCHVCSNTGYQDRIGVYELLRVTQEMKRLIVGWATQDELRRLAQSQGMKTLREEAVALVEADVTTVDEVIRNIYAV